MKDKIAVIALFCLTVNVLAFTVFAAVLENVPKALFFPIPFFALIVIFCMLASFIREAFRK